MQNLKGHDTPYVWMFLGYTARRLLSRGWLLRGGARWFGSRRISGEGNLAEDQVRWEDHIIEDDKVTGRSGSVIGVRYV